jgi:hypothetical protein
VGLVPSISGENAKKFAEKMCWLEVVVCAIARSLQAGVTRGTAAEPFPLAATG